MAPPKNGKPTSSTPSRGRRVIDFIEANCVFTNGEWIGQPFVLLPWQKRLIMELFEVRRDGKRRYRWAYIQVAKKNGKTELAAALALYFLIADGEPSPLVVCAAGSDDQADLVFGAAKTMCDLSPTLRLITERFEREILVPSIPGAKLKRVAATAGTNDGQNIHAVICDELHEWTGPKGEQVWNVLTNGTGARKQPMVVQITTAGWDLETVCGRQYELSRAIERGEIDKPNHYSFIIEAPDGADWKSPAVWQASNPSWGVTVEEDFFRDQASTKTESVFRRYFLDQWVEAEDLWLPFGAWDACRDPSIELNPKLPLVVGVDLGLVNDSTAVLMTQYRPDIDRVVVRAKFWQNPHPPGTSQRDAWRFDVRLLDDFLLKLREEYPVRWRRLPGEWVPGPLYCYDPWGMRETAEYLESSGLVMIEVPQIPSRLVPAARILYDLIVSERLAHDGDPILAEHLRNVVPVIKGDSWWLDKPKASAKKIDGARALLNAITELPIGDEAVTQKPIGAFLA